MLEKKYESIDIDGIESILQYSEFYNIAVLFDEHYSNKKIKNFYESMNSAYLSENTDFFMLINSIENIDNYDNVRFNTELLNAVKDEIQQGNLFEAKIDLQSTVYGIILADNFGFHYNKDKVQNYINQNYDFIDESSDHLEVTNYLYYTVMLEQIVNDYKVEYNSNYLQEKMDFVLKEIEYGLENAEESIEETRKILELVMDLEIHNVDVHITEKQRRKIKKAIKAYWKNENVANSYLIIDMYLIDKILGFHIISDEDFVQVHDLLLLNGGNRMYADNSFAADIFTTYKFENCLEQMNNYTCLEEKKVFADSLQIKEGIYCLYDDTENVFVELASVLYGNSICKREVGGDKFD